MRGTRPLEILMSASWMVGAMDTICLQQTEVFSQPRSRPAIAENPSEEGLRVCRKTMFLVSICRAGILLLSRGTEAPALLRGGGRDGKRLARRAEAACLAARAQPANSPSRR